MPNPDLGNPFSEMKKPDIPTEVALESLLGPGVAEQYRSAMGEGDDVSDITSDTLVMSPEEVAFVTAQMFESPETREQVRAKFIEWAEQLGEDRDWVDDNFIFDDPKKVIAKDNLYLSGLKNSLPFPSELYEIKGNVYLNEADIDSLKNVNLPVAIWYGLYLTDNKLKSLLGIRCQKMDGLYLDNNQLETLEEFPKVSGHISLTNNQLRSLKGIRPLNCVSLNISNNPHLTNLDDLAGSSLEKIILFDIPATTIPTGIKVRDAIYVSAQQVALIHDAETKGYPIIVEP